MMGNLLKKRNFFFAKKKEKKGFEDYSFIKYVTCTCTGTQHEINTFEIKPFFYTENTIESNII